MTLMLHIQNIGFFSVNIINYDLAIEISTENILIIKPTDRANLIVQLEIMT